MDWPRSSYALALLTLLPFVHCWSTTTLGGAGGQANVVGAGAGAGAIGAGNTGASTARAQITNVSLSADFEPPKAPSLDTLSAWKTTNSLTNASNFQDPDWLPNLDILLPPLHIKLGIAKKFIEDNFRKAWNALKAVIEEVLGKNRVQQDKAQELVKTMLHYFHEIKASMTLKLKQLPTESDEQGERFHQVTMPMEKRYKGKRLDALLAEVCWWSHKVSQYEDKEVSPYIDLVLCPMREQPWGCARQKSARILDLWDNDLQMQWQKLKVEADRQLNATIEKRGYSASEVLTREKPSTILKKIEIGTSYMKKYLAETMDGFLGREYDYVQTDPKQNFVTTDEDDDDNNEEEEDSDTEYEEDDDEEGNETDAESETVQQGEEDYTDRDEVASQHIASFQGRPAAVNGQLHHSEVPLLIGTAPAEANHDASAGVEFIEIEENENAPTGQLKKPGGGSKKKRKNKKKKKPETLLVVQPAELELHGHGGHHGWDVHGHGGQHDEVVEWVPVTQGHSKPSKKQKRKKKKKHQHADDSVSVVVEQEPSDHLGLGLLEELADAVDVVDLDEGHKRKHKKPHKYGRSVGVTRGKKKKKKKALAKLVLLGSFLKAKIELLLKILGAHLQIKFFAIALIGLLINIARFWIDVKRGGTPQKVVYVEHAHHQHHYDEHNEDWGGESGGSYWKRSLQTDPSLEEAATDSYQPVPQNQDPHFMAYRRQWQ
ncbi:uncharacterized protein LOC129242035 [Anastrepha obliqua]|uniref:uncharacterized protein LOC129242035 n=1 Tax=Anastrepha obliqua TaxID=95512 RepID=UPI002409DEFB|nr:uncharacterized protein LOC129242035 [Anastrepha obliqua]